MTNFFNLPVGETNEDSRVDRIRECVCRGDFCVPFDVDAATTRGVGSARQLQQLAAATAPAPAHGRGNGRGGGRRRGRATHNVFAAMGMHGQMRGMLLSGAAGTRPQVSAQHRGVVHRRSACCAACCAAAAHVLRGSAEAR